MKKRFFVLILMMILAFIILFSTKVFAASANLSVSSSSIHVGDTFTVTVNVSSAAAWNVHVSTSGPVSGGTINQADASADAMNTNKTFTATGTATGEGTITIKLSGDVTSEDGNNPSIGGTKTITVTAKPSNNTNQSTKTNNTPVNTEKKPTTSNNEENKLSKNSNIKDLSVEGYELRKLDNNTYELIVAKNITNININGTVEDDKATISGIGNKELVIGLNAFEVIVTSEAGGKSIYTVNVTRKDSYYLEDLNNIIDKEDSESIEITISKDAKITEEMMQKIKETQKKVNFNYYNEEKKLMYSWEIDGAKISNISGINTNIAFLSEHKDEIDILSNYASGSYIELENTDRLPEGATVKIYVADKFADGNLINVYYFSKEEKNMKNVKNALEVKDGYIEFEATSGPTYFLTRSDLQKIKSEEEKQNEEINIFMIISIVEAIVIVLMIGMYLAKIKSKEKQEK